MADQRDPGALRHWLAACGITGETRPIGPAAWEWTRTEETDLPANRDKGAYRVRLDVVPGAAKDLGNALLPGILHDFLFRQQRWKGDPCGDLRVRRDPVRDLGCVYHNEPIASFTREWYIYVPTAARREPDKPLPLVFAMHGHSCNGDIYCGHSGWCAVAEEHGFLVVFPSALPGYLFVPSEENGSDVPERELPAWNFLGVPGKPDEFTFFKELLERVCAEYAVDRSRVYATGHSHGSMMSHALGLALTDRFAAIVPRSGTMFAISREPSILSLDAVKNRADAELPCWMFAGEKEPWLIPHLPAPGNKTAEAIEAWRAADRLTPAIADWSAVPYGTDGTWHTATFNDKAGRPLVKYTWIEGMPHALTPDMAKAIWERFFSKYRREGGQSGVRRLRAQ